MSVLTKFTSKGINNLRVFDVSMMPNIIAANTNVSYGYSRQCNNIMLEG